MPVIFPHPDPAFERDIGYDDDDNDDDDDDEMSLEGNEFRTCA